MRWSDVGYAHRGMRVVAQFTTPSEPDLQVTLVGTVVCAREHALPLLRSLDLDYHLPSWADIEPMD